MQLCAGFNAAGLPLRQQQGPLEEFLSRRREET